MNRIAKFDRLLGVLAERIFRPVGHPVSLRFRRAQDGDRPRVITEPREGWAPVGPELVWGEPEGYFWFGGTAIIPPEAAGERVVARIEAQFGSTMGRSDPQCLVRIDGRIAQGGDGNHREFRLMQPAVAGTSFDILIEAGTIEDRRQLGFALTLHVHDLLAEEIFYDLKVPLDVARLLKPDDARRHAILNIIDEAFAALDLRPGDLPRFHASLRAGKAAADRIYALADTEAMPTIIAAGHTHIDVAWLWRVRETRQKMARSMATALDLMDEFPDYVFMYNQGYLFDTLDQDYPELFQRLKDKVAGGQFEVEGALWLEPDVNIAGGEALVRHILHGVVYHEKTFGIRARLLWLPDTFGYSAALPQIMAKSGLTMFVTHKLSWNDTNRMPAEAFQWQGIDGTRVPAAFVTTQRYESDAINTTYCADLTPSHVLGTWKRHSQQADMAEMFMIYGHGDGGGGPTRRMVENIRRMERGIPGCPKVRHDRLMPHFDRLAARMEAEPKRFPTWVGELYLEYHRGTLTSVAKNKRANRQAEILLRELELLGVLAGADIKVELWELWQIVLLNQFHDILPGSGYGPVYEDSDADYARFFAGAKALEARLAGMLGGAVVLNASGRARGGFVEMDGPGAQVFHAADGSERMMMPVGEIAGSGYVALPSPHAPLPSPLVGEGAPKGRMRGPGGAATPHPAFGHLLPQGEKEGAHGEKEESALLVTPTSLENARLRVTLDASGRITSLFDKQRKREVLKAGTVGNRLVAFQDYPLNFDAWDIDWYYEEKSWEIDRLVSSQVVETGPHRAAIRLEWAYESSRIVQILSLEADGDRLEVDGFIDWHEQHTLLKMLTPVDVTTAEVRAEIQFGHVRRPTHRNTSWDRARFESAMQRWVDLSEPGFGVALLNDCKYGFDAHDNVLSLSILRSPTYPWDQADQGEHRFRYALMPHGGAEAGIGRVVEAAEDFNMPVRVVYPSSAPSGHLLPQGEKVEHMTSAVPDILLPLREKVPEGRMRGLFTLDADGIAVEAVKAAEDGSGAIVRLYETRGRRSEGRLTGAFRSASEVDLLEQTIRPLDIASGRIALALKPFEILSLKLDLAR